MKIAVAGKGGSGKTTIAGTLACVVAERGTPVVAIDDDSNPNLALTLGLAAEAATPPALPRDLLEERVDDVGQRWLGAAATAPDDPASRPLRVPHAKAPAASAAVMNGLIGIRDMSDLSTPACRGGEELRH